MLISDTVKTLIVVTTVLLATFAFLKRWLAVFDAIPVAHPLTRFTRSWILWQRWRGNEMSTIQAAFVRYGPLIRLGPDEVAVGRMTGGVRIIHGCPGFDKSDWYDFFINYGHRNAFSAHTAKEHAVLRRLHARVYSKTYIQSSSHVQACISTMIFNRYVPMIERSLKESVDILGLNLGFGVDVVTAFTFGRSLATNLIESLPDRREWLDMHMGSHCGDASLFMTECPSTFGRIAAFLPFVGSMQRYHRGRFEEWVLARVNQCELRLEGGDFEARDCGDAPLLFGQIRSSMLAESFESTSSKKSTLTHGMKLQAASECLDHIHAARDTFGISLTYTMGQLAQRPVLQNNLYIELKSLLPSEALSVFTSSRAADITYDCATHGISGLLEKSSLLDAVIKEGLRLRDTVPTPNPRVVPDGPDGDGVVLCGHKVLPGTRVSCFAWAVHRDPDAYSHAEAFDPARWLGNGPESKQAEANFWALGSGSRICIGQHLALEMLRHVLAAMCLRYTFEITTHSNEGCLTGDFVKGGNNECLSVKFKHRK